MELRTRLSLVILWPIDLLAFLGAGGEAGVDIVESWKHLDYGYTIQVAVLEHCSLFHID